jgi:hypothetical protein
VGLQRCGDGFSADGPDDYLLTMTIVKLLKKDRTFRVWVAAFLFSTILMNLSVVAQDLIMMGVLPNPDPLFFGPAKPETQKPPSRGDYPGKMRPLDSAGGK